MVGGHPLERGGGTMSTNEVIALVALIAQVVYVVVSISKKK